MKVFRLFVLAVLTAGLVMAESLLRQSDRIIFVGDSITAQAVGGSSGYYHQFTNELKRVYPSYNNEVIGLGFSGNTIYSWADSIEVRSRTGSVPANTGGFDVHKAFAKHGDIVFILLGMNDILRPTVRNNEAALQDWKSKYRQLIQAIRKRVTPREMILCEITPLTEDPVSPKNRVRDQLHILVGELAKEENCRVATTGAEVFKTVKRCRRVKQDYHVIPDTVHPKPLGHSAMMKAMVASLNDDNLVQAFEARIAKQVSALTSDGPALTYWFKPTPGAPATGAEQSYNLTCYWNDGKKSASKKVPTFSLELPAGWSTDKTSVKGIEADFTFKGSPELLQTPVTIVAKTGSDTLRQRVMIPAPWRVLCGPDNAGPWGAKQAYEPTKSIPPMEKEILSGDHFQKPFSIGENVYDWQVNTPCADYTDGKNPNSVLPYSLTFGSENDVLYAVRWVYSPKARPVKVELTHRTFSATHGFVVWINGEQVMKADLNRQGKNIVLAKAELKQGWNWLLVRNDHRQWQRQFACALLPAEGDKLDDLKYAVVPR